MRVFSRPSGLERLSLEARLVYSGFCIFMLLGLGSSLWLFQADGLHRGTVAVNDYYLGQPTESSAEASLDGPALDLPPSSSTSDPSASSQELKLEKPIRQVMETFHFHLFSVSVCLLIIAHLFMMCGWRTWFKAAVVVLSYVGTLAHLVVPLLIRLHSPSWAHGMAPSALIMATTWLLMLSLPLVEMWVLIPKRRARAS